MDIEKINLEKLYIKLGSDCNLNCKYCHSEHKNIIFNKEILPIIKKLCNQSNKFEHLTLSGGEPLVYWNIIKQIVEYLGKDIRYRIITNGTLFTQEIVDFCNKYDFFFSISLDGDNGTRDTSKQIKWNLISQLNHASSCVTIYNENQNIRETLLSIDKYKKKYLTIKPGILSSYPNFVHSTTKTGSISSHNLAVSYIKQMIDLFDESVNMLKNYHIKTVFLKRFLEVYCKHKTGKGVRCCREDSICMLSNGDICVCPYTLEKVGDIFHLNELNFEKIEQTYLKSSCRSCDIFDICKNTCCVNITNDECYIMKEMHKNISTVLEKYNTSYEELISYYEKKNV